MNIGHPTVSVIIPTYNRAKYVLKAINSVLAQTYKEYEIIVVDDGSTDNTQEVLEQYMDKINYIYQDNKGGSIARNVGIKASNSEWIGFLDSDDEWLPNKLAVQMENIHHEQEMNFQVTNINITRDILGEEINLFNHRNFLNKIERNFLFLKRPLKYLLKYDFVFTPSVIVKRRILIEAGLFDPELIAGHDIDLWYRIALWGSWGICSQQLAKVLRREEIVNNLTNQKKDQIRHSNDSLYSLNKLINHEKLEKHEKYYVYQAMSSVKRALGNELLLAGKKSEAKKIFFQAFINYLSVKSLFKYIISWMPINISKMFIKK
ncbi:glycosyltransferase family 2 protein [Candidatus Latescibacterota bacterium]